MVDKDLWLSRGSVAALLGVSPLTFDNSLRTKLPESSIRGRGRTLQFRAADCVQSLVDYRVQQAGPRKPLSEDDALLYSDSDSPNLERLRAAKADREEMARDRDRGTHANLADLHTALMRMGGLLRRGGEVLQRKFGPEAAEIHNQAIDSAERECIDNI